MTLLYNERLLNHQMARLEMSVERLAELANISLPTAYVALSGRLGTLRLLRRVTDVLKIRWEFITQVDLPESEFHRAVLTNGDRRVRTVKSGPVPVGVNRPRSKELRP